MALPNLIETAYNRRIELMQSLKSEDTNAFRLFHGIGEGFPGLSLDIYGNLLLIQTYRDILTGTQLDQIRITVRECLSISIPAVYRHREKNRANLIHRDPEVTEAEFLCREQGCLFEVLNFKQGLDPLLFLDIRSGRRHLSRICKDRSVLNLFAYTCAAGVIAASSSASSVINIDFSETWLGHGRQNAKHNDISKNKCRFIHDDCISVIRQFAGLPMKGRAVRRGFKKYQKQSFDIIFLDPPTFSKGRFGAVDIVSDYQSLFKPAILSLNSGGEIICTNHSGKIEMDEWLQSLERCASKAGKKIVNMHQILPDIDFPSPDNRPPLKILAIRFD